MKKILSSASAELVAKLNECGRSKSFAENQTIFFEGEQASFLPLVLSGKVKMVRFPEVGKEIIIGIFSSGEMFAIPPVFDGGKYPSTAIAMRETKLLLLERVDFMRILGESNEFSFAVIGWMCEMLREKTATIQNLTTASPEHRIANLLLRLAKKETSAAPVKITLRRQDLAEMSGLTTETTIRAVRRLAEKDLVKIVHGKIILDEIQPLRDFLREQKFS